MNLAILVALINGFNFAFNLLMTKVMMSRWKFPPMQLNFDICLAMVPLLLPYFIADLVINGMTFTLLDIVLYNVAFLLGVIGMIMLTIGVKYGKGGICQAIENLKSPWQTLIMIAFTGGEQVPTLM